MTAKYKVLYAYPEELEAQLNQYAEDGYELFDITTPTKARYQGLVCAVLVKYCFSTSMYGGFLADASDDDSEAITSETSETGGRGNA